MIAQLESKIRFSRPNSPADRLPVVPAYSVKAAALWGAIAALWRGLAAKLPSEHHFPSLD